MISTIPGTMDGMIHGYTDTMATMATATTVGDMAIPIAGMIHGITITTAISPSTRV